MVQIYTCQNGVRIVSEHVPYVHSVTIGIWVDAGSRYELPHENGITHFIEHMLFKGTQSRTARQIAEAFDRIGGEINAFTSKENTCYYTKVLAHHGEHAMDMLADMFFNSAFRQEDIEREQQVVLEEILMSEDAADDDIHEKLWFEMYPKDALGLPILGTAQTLETFNADMIRSYMDKHYAPENVVISVAGNVSTALIQHIEQLFGHYGRTEKFVKSELTYPTFTAGFYMQERDIEQSHVAMSYPAIDCKDSRFYSFVALNNLIGGNMSSRLFQEVREERGLAYTIFSYETAYADVGAFTIYGSTSNKQMPVLLQTIDDTLASIVKSGITYEELSNAKEQLKASVVLGIESMETRMSRNGKAELIYGKHKTIDDVIAGVDAISMEACQELIEEMLTKERAIAIIQGTEDNE